MFCFTISLLVPIRFASVLLTSIYSNLSPAKPSHSLRSTGNTWCVTHFRHLQHCESSVPIYHNQPLKWQTTDITFPPQSEKSDLTHFWSFFVLLALYLCHLQSKCLSASILLPLYLSALLLHNNHPFFSLCCMVFSLLSLLPSPHCSFPCAGGNPNSCLTAVDEVRHYVTGSEQARQPALTSVSKPLSNKVGSERQAGRQGPHPIFMKPVQHKFFPCPATVQ